MCKIRICCEKVHTNVAGVHERLMQLEVVVGIRKGLLKTTKIVTIHDGVEQLWTGRVVLTHDCTVTELGDHSLDSLPSRVT